MNLSLATREALQSELQKLSDEIAERQEQKNAIEVLLGPPPSTSPPFPYHTEPVVAKPVLKKINLTSEFRVFLAARPTATFSVKNFKAHLETNFDESQWNPDSVGMVLQNACKAGDIVCVKKGSRGSANPNIYRVKGVTIV